MADPYPQNFTIEIDRENWCRSMRRTAYMAWMLAAPAVCAVLGFVIRMQKEPTDPDWTLERYMSVGSIGVVVGLAIGLALGLVGYWAINHFRARRRVEALSASVEGQYLRVRDGTHFRFDQKIHFHAIVDFTCYQTASMQKHGLTGILMTTVSGNDFSTINLPAVKDAEKVRNMLAEIDRLREDLKPA